MRLDLVETIGSAFDAQARRTPARVALVGEDSTLTFAQLEARSNQVATHLVELGVEVGARVAIALPRSAEAVVAMLGVMKAGAAYVAIDPAHPAKRREFVLHDSDARAVFATEPIPGSTVPLITPADVTAADCAGASPRTPAGLTAGDLAYVTYTSGSTGKPKGVMGPHSGALDGFRWLWERYPFGEDETVVARTSFSFIDSIWEVFAPLTRGVPVVVGREETVGNPVALCRALAEYRCCRVVVVPSLLREVLDMEPYELSQVSGVRFWLSSGEAIPVDMARDFVAAFPNSTLVNLYGTSEIFNATWFAISRANAADLGPSVSLGTALPRTAVFVLDRVGRGVPLGASGEICVGGTGLARGYLGRPALTAEKFVPNPYSREPGARLYRTGDVGRFGTDKSLFYLGRRDTQVRIRGNRVELGEIESHLRTSPHVREAVVVTQRDRVGREHLVAFAIPKSVERADASALQGFLREHLPSYMIPSRITAVDSLPLTPTGKVDRRVLSDAVFAPPVRPTTAAVTPRTAAEKLIARMFADVLGLDDVDVHDDFFDLGGDSLLAAQLANRIAAVADVDVPLRTIFDASTVAELATALWPGPSPVPASHATSLATDDAAS